MESWYQDIVEEKGYLIEIQDLFGPNPGAQEEPPLVILEGLLGV